MIERLSKVFWLLLLKILWIWMAVAAIIAQNTIAFRIDMIRVLNEEMSTCSRRFLPNTVNISRRIQHYLKLLISAIWSLISSRRDAICQSIESISEGERWRAGWHGVVFVGSSRSAEEETCLKDFYSSLCCFCKVNEKDYINYRFLLCVLIDSFVGWCFATSKKVTEFLQGKRNLEFLPRCEEGIFHFQNKVEEKLYHFQWYLVLCNSFRVL